MHNAVRKHNLKLDRDDLNNLGWNPRLKPVFFRFFVTFIVHTIFSAPEPKDQVQYCDHACPSSLCL